MSRFAALAMLLPAATLLADHGPGLGEAVSAEDVETYDYVVLPNGEGLPAGRGDAREGAPLFESHCQACHGARGNDGINDRLAGGHGSLSGAQPQKTVGSYWPYATTLFDYIRRAMPYQAPGTLGDDEVYALTAYILHINDIIDADHGLDAETLPAVTMPNRDGFVWSYRP